MAVISFEQRQLSYVLNTVQTGLDSWLTRIDVSPRFELGADEAFIETFAGDLKHLSSLLQSVRQQFDLRYTSVHEAKRYFTAVSTLKEAHCYAEDIQSSAFGTVRNTHQMIKYLDGCRTLLAELQQAAGNSQASIG